MEPVENKTSEIENICAEFTRQVVALRRNTDGIRQQAYNLAEPTSPPVLPDYPPSNKPTITIVDSIWSRLTDLNDMNNELAFLSEHLTRIAGK